MLFLKGDCIVPLPVASWKSHFLFLWVSFYTLRTVSEDMII